MFVEFIHVTWILPIVSHKNAKSWASCLTHELPRLISTSKKILTRLDYTVVKVSLLHIFCIFIIEMEGFVLILQLECKQLLSMSIKRLNPIKKQVHSLSIIFTLEPPLL
jgi:hypothetical protein